MGGTKAKPAIVCANKECGYKRAVEEPREGEEPPVAGTSTAAQLGA